LPPARRDDDRKNYSRDDRDAKKYVHRDDSKSDSRRDDDRKKSSRDDRRNKRDEDLRRNTRRDDDRDARRDDRSDKRDERPNKRRAQSDDSDKRRPRADVKGTARRSKPTFPDVWDDRAVNQRDPRALAKMEKESAERIAAIKEAARIKEDADQRDAAIKEAVLQAKAEWDAHLAESKKGNWQGEKGKKGEKGDWKGEKGKKGEKGDWKGRPFAVEGDSFRGGSGDLRGKGEGKPDAPKWFHAWKASGEKFIPGSSLLVLNALGTALLMLMRGQRVELPGRTREIDPAELNMAHEAFAARVLDETAGPGGVHYDELFYLSTEERFVPPNHLEQMRRVTTIYGTRLDPEDAMNIDLMSTPAYLRLAWCPTSDFEQLIFIGGNEVKTRIKHAVKILREQLAAKDLNRQINDDDDESDDDSPDSPDDWKPASEGGGTSLTDKIMRLTAKDAEAKAKSKAKNTTKPVKAIKKASSQGKKKTPPGKKSKKSSKSA